MEWRATTMTSSTGNKASARAPVARRQSDALTRWRAGFTLVELLVAAVVLAAGLVGVLMALGRVLEGAAIIASEAQATVLAQHALDEMELAARARQALPVGGQAGAVRWVTQVTPDRDPRRPLETWAATVEWPVRQQMRAMHVSRVWKRL